MLNIKSKYLLFSIDILTIALILLVAVVPNSIIRIIIGLPMILFFPGYVLISALFHRKSYLDGIERLALSLVLSLSLFPIIGLFLNYTPWGITVFSVLFSLAIFILVLSVISWFRQRKLREEEYLSFNIDLTGWNKRSSISKVISVVLVMIIIGTVAMLTYTIAKQKTGEKFTEFYILDLDGKAIDYPKVIQLGDHGKITMVIINNEQQLTRYMVEIKIDGFMNETFEPILLEADEKAVREVTFTPKSAGDQQKVEFLLYKDGQGEPYLNLHLWINVK